MKKISAVIALTFCFFAQTKVRATPHAPTDSVIYKRIEHIYALIKSHYAPDKRTSLFNYRIISAAPLAVSIETTSPEAVTAFKEKLRRENIEARVTDSILPSKALGGKIYGVVSLSVCNNRLMPENSAEMVTQALLGTPVDILKEEHGYYLVRTPDKYISWTDDAGVEAMDKRAFDTWKAGQKIVFTAPYGHAFAEPSESSLPVSDLVAGNILRLLSKEAGFYKVGYPDGRTGYIPAPEAELYSKWVSRPDPDAEHILNTAKTLIGVPYLWGGTSIKGVDCSGFTKTSYFLNGIILSRDASQQALNGQSVDISEGDTVSIEKCLKNLKAGDLLFFGRKKNVAAPSRVTHTAIYIGNGEFIQSAGMVRISSLLKNQPNYDSYQAHALLSARRVLTAIGSEGICRIDKHPYYQTEIK